MPSLQPAKNKSVGRLAAALALAIPFGVIFGPALASGATFVFRDAAHFYYPTFHWVNAQWRAGHIPLWNVQENTGVPALADATSSVFYPGKLLFLLPGSFAWRYKLYILAHVLLAAGAAYYVARRWRRSREAAALAAACYAFGGPVVFQYCNVVFLVGAAWLPLGLFFYERSLRRRSLRDAAAAGVVMAMMVLGGDPQSAYHTVLAGGLLGLLGWFRRWRRRSDPGEMSCAVGVHASACVRDENTRKRELQRRVAKCAVASVRSTDGHASRRREWPSFSVGSRHPLALLCGGAALALALSAVQVWPSWEWSRQSTRAAHDAPRNIYEAAALAAGGNVNAGGGENEAPSQRWGTIKQGLLRAPAIGSHHRQLYEFSVGPWRWPEMIWPNISGRLFPVHRRWIRALPAEGRTWTPTLYMGLPCLLLALLAGKRGGMHGRWCASLIFVGVVGALGWFGLAWLAHEIQYALGDANKPKLAAPVGGLYWFFVVCLPGYAMFRYPAKLFVLAAFGISQLAAGGLDAKHPQLQQNMQRLAIGLGGVSAALLAASFALANVWAEQLRNMPGDDLFGPFDAPGALLDVRCAVLHALLVCVVLVLLVRWSAGRFGRRWRLAVLLLGVLDLAVAQRSLVPLDDRLPRNPASAAARQIELHQRSLHAETRYSETANRTPLRVFRERSAGWLPARWAQTRSWRRQAEGLRWDLDTLAPRYQLLSRLALLESSSSLQSHDYAAVLQEGFRHLDSEHAGRRPHASVLNVLGARYCIGAANTPTSEEKLPPWTGATASNSKALPENTQITFRTASFPRVWLVGRVAELPRLYRPTPSEIEQRTREVFFPANFPRDFHHSAVVEGKLPASWPGSLKTEGDPSRAQVRVVTQVVSKNSDTLEIEVHTEQASLLVVSDFFYPGWTAEITNLESGQRRVAPILRTNRIMRGVALPAGRSRIVMHYRPWSFYGGAALSLIAWAGLAIACFRLRSNRRNGTTKTRKAGDTRKVGGGSL